METRRKRKPDSIFNQPLNTTTKKLRQMAEYIDKIKVVTMESETKQLDIAFAMDCTGSMQSYINDAKQNIYRIVEEIVASEQCDVRLALVEYRDHPPQDSTFVTNCHDFTSSPKTMKGWLNSCAAAGGGDTPEAVADALQDLLKLSWREDATKICVCVSDAPPHGLGCWSDGFPDGCPDGIDPMVVANQLAAKGITLYVAGCEPAISPYKEFFMAIAYITGGQYVPLRQAKSLSNVIIYGAKEEISLHRLTEEVDAEIQGRQAAGEDIDETNLSTVLHQRWTSRGQQSIQLQMGETELSGAQDNEEVQALSKLKTMSEMRSRFKLILQSSFYGRPIGGSGSLFGSAAGKDTSASSYSFGSVATGVSFAQSSRLVQKSMAKWKSSSKN